MRIAIWLDDPMAPVDDAVKAPIAAAAEALRKAGAKVDYEARPAFDARQQREIVRWAWHDFFQQYDVVLAPSTTTAAFPHDHSEPATSRVLTVNGRATDYFAQLFWAGLAVCPLLPATAAPVGFTPEGLPVGLQIIGPEMGDLKTISVARELERLIGGFEAPPGLSDC